MPKAIVPTSADCRRTVLIEPKLKNSGCGMPMARIIRTNTMIRPVSSDQRKRGSRVVMLVFGSLVAFDTLITEHAGSFSFGFTINLSNTLSRHARPSLPMQRQRLRRPPRRPPANRGRTGRSALGCRRTTEAALEFANFPSVRSAPEGVLVPAVLRVVVVAVAVREPVSRNVV